MKILVQISRVLVGLLFIFSGIVKLNDPSGFSLKLNEYFDVFAQDVAAKQDTMTVSFMEGPRTLGSKQFVLYSFDRERQLEFQNTYDAQKDPTDSTGRIQRYDARVTVMMGSETIAQHDYSAIDSNSSAMFAVKVTIGGKAAFQKTLMASPAKPLVGTQSVDVQQYVKAESWLNKFFKGMKDYSLWLSIFVCALEVILGFALIVGWKSRLTAWLLLLLIIFFTFLTFYAANYNKVTDCGCFGDFLKLKPWHSFYKDLILLFFILIIFIGARYIKPWFSKKFGWKFMSIISILTVAFGVLCYLYLPLWDFLPFKKGNDIKKILTYLPPGERAQDSVNIYYMMHKGSDSAKVPFIKSPYKEYMDKVNAGWKPGRQIPEVIIEGYDWPIHDFHINDAVTGADMKDSILNYSGFQLLWIVPFVEHIYQGCIKESREIYAWANEKNLPFVAVTASVREDVSKFVQTNKVPYGFFTGDQKMLMTVARYNPTLYLMNGSVVVKKWSGRNLPSTKSLEKYISR